MGGGSGRGEDPHSARAPPDDAGEEKVRLAPISHDLDTAAGEAKVIPANTEPGSRLDEENKVNEEEGEEEGGEEEGEEEEEEEAAAGGEQGE